MSMRDWVALTDIPLTCEPMHTCDLTVLATAVGGQVVHRAEGAP